MDEWQARQDPDRDLPNPHPGSGPGPAFELPTWRDIPRWAHPDNDRLSNRLVAHLSRWQRNHLMGQRVDALERLAVLDDALVDLSRERREILATLDVLRDTLWPVDPHSKGRRPPRHDERVLAPADEHSRVLSGRRLRSTCLSILRRHGTLALRDLHDLLHRYGYAVGGAEPVKALADAMGHEHDEGRAVRVHRGTYAARRGPVPTRRSNGTAPLPTLIAPPAEPARSDQGGDSGSAIDPDLVDDVEGRITPSRGPVPQPPDAPPSTVTPSFTSGSSGSGRRATRRPYGAHRHRSEHSLRPRRAPP